MNGFRHATYQNGYIINWSGHVADKTEQTTYQIPDVTHKFAHKTCEIKHMVCAITHIVDGLGMAQTFLDTTWMTIEIWHK